MRVRSRKRFVIKIGLFSNCESQVFEYLKQRITIAPKDDYKKFLEFAEKIAPHEKDAPYLALALKLKIPVWSNDRDLKEKQDYVKVYNTKDLLEML